MSHIISTHEEDNELATEVEDIEDDDSDLVKEKELEEESKDLESMAENWPN